MLCKCMNIWCVQKACMSPTPSGSLALQCIKLSDVLEIRDEIIFNSIWDCHAYYFVISSKCKLFNIIISLGERVSVLRNETVDCEGTKVFVSNVCSVLNCYIRHYYRYIEVHVPQNRCSYYNPTGGHTARHGVHPTDTCPWSMRVSEWLCQLHGDHLVHFLNHLCVCVPYTMPAYLPLAVAVWGPGSFPGVACANYFPPKVAFNWHIRHCIFDNHEILSESSISGCSSGDNICSAILHAVLWTRKNSELNLATANVYIIGPVHEIYTCLLHLGASSRSYNPLSRQGIRM